MAVKKKKTKPIKKKTTIKKQKIEPAIKKKEKGFLEKEFLGISNQLWLIAGILIIIALGFVYTQYTGPQEIDNDNIPSGNGEDMGKLEITIITDSQLCPNCEIDSSLVSLLEKNNIPYNINIIDEDSDIRQQAIEKYDIKRFPTYLVYASSITDKMLITNTSGNPTNIINVFVYYAEYFNYYAKKKGMEAYNFKYNEEDNTFIMEDIFIWDSEQHMSYIIDANTTDTNLKLIYDPYNPYFVTNYKNFNTKLRDLDMDFYLFPQETIEFQEKYYNSESGYIGWLNVPKYFVCMDEQDAFWEFSDKYIELYCNIESIEDSDKCSASPNYGYPLSESALAEIKDKLVENEVIDATQFAICYGDGKTKIEEEMEMGYRLNITEIPTLVAGYSYQGYLSNIELFLCGFPEYQSLGICNAQ